MSCSFPITPSGSTNRGFSPALSSDGQILVFTSCAALDPLDTNGVADLYCLDRMSGVRTILPIAGIGIQSNGASDRASLSYDGRLVAFQSDASNLVSGDTNGATDVFVFDRNTGITRRVSVRTDGGEANGPSGSPVISGNGRMVAFVSAATNLVDGDTNGKADIFVHDLYTGETRLISVAPDGGPANGDSWGPSLSRDGQVVAFVSSASNLVSGDTNGQSDIFVRDLGVAMTSRVSIGVGGVEGNGASGFLPSAGPSNASLSSSGRFVAFDSQATNLVPGDYNAKANVFIRDRTLSTTVRVSILPDGTETNGDSGFPVISGDEGSILFLSKATNLVPGATTGAAQIFRTQNPLLRP